MNKNLGPEIKELYAQGFTKKEIQDKLCCAKSTVAYHTNINIKINSLKRTKRNRLKRHPFVKKTDNFKAKRKKSQPKNKILKTELLLKLKIETFFKSRIRSKRNIYVKPEFTYQDVIDKFGENPKCYLTGKEINIYEPRTYNFDHIIPVTRGGENTLENLGICTKSANQAKYNLSINEFFELCKSVLEYNGFNVTKKDV